jgi:hypothetical protein
MFNSFVSDLKSNGLVCMRISDDVLDEENWGIDGLTIEDGVVVRQLHLSKGAYTMPDVVGWTTKQLMEWTQYDATGSHPEQYHELSIEEVI